MTILDKYELETITTGTTGTSGIFDSNMDKIEDNLHTYLRYQVASGESIAAYDPLAFVNNEWKQANDPGSGEIKCPSAVAIELGVSGEYVRGQRAGPLTNSEWTWSGSGEVWLGAAGEITQTSNNYKIGNVISTTAIVIQL